MFKKILPYLFFTLISLIYVMTFRGVLGNPTEIDLQKNNWKEAGPLELSPERGRYALLYSIVEHKSFKFTESIGNFAAPDVGVLKGKYVSLFAPLLSFTLIPGYVLGKVIGLSQVGTFFTISVFAILNAFFIGKIAVRLGAGKIASCIAALAFVFGTPAFSYGVSLYQHHLSTLFILLALYALFRFRSWIAGIVVSFLFAASIPLDYPNLFFFFPVFIYSVIRMFGLERIKSVVRVKFRFLSLLSIVSFALPVLFFLWFNNSSYGNPFQLSGTLPTKAVQVVKDTSSTQDKSLLLDSKGNNITKKEAVTFFKTRNIINGLYIHSISPDRGVIFYAPIVLFGIFGAIYLWSKKQKELVLLISIICANVVLYSMWGDPWGGWAFGSRYLIPSYAILSILVAFAFKKFNKNAWFYIAFFLVGVYSIAVNTLGAITTNANPPQVEVLALEKLSGVQERYMFDRNYFYLLNTGSKSFTYNNVFKNILTPVQYYVLLVITLTATLNILMVSHLLKKHD